MRNILLAITAILICQSALAESPSKTTQGVIDIENLKRPEAAVQLVGDAGHLFVPVGKEATRWVFKEGVLTASPKWDSVVTPTAYRSTVPNFGVKNLLWRSF